MSLDAAVSVLERDAVQVPMVAVHVGDNVILYVQKPLSGAYNN